jgi:hypothetical protein
MSIIVQPIDSIFMTPEVENTYVFNTYVFNTYVFSIRHSSILALGFSLGES